MGTPRHDSDSDHEHEQVRIIIDWEDEAIEVDAGIADLIQAIYRVGLRTFMSCESTSDTGLMWIAFRDADSVIRFMDITCFNSNVVPQLSEMLRIINKQV